MIFFIFHIFIKKFTYVQKFTVMVSFFFFFHTNCLYQLMQFRCWTSWWEGESGRINLLWHLLRGNFSFLIWSQLSWQLMLSVLWLFLVLFWMTDGFFLYVLFNSWATYVLSLLSICMQWFLLETYVLKS